MSTISAGTTSTTTLIHSGDTTGSLVLKTNDTGSGGTTAVTIGTDQSFNFSATGQRITGDFSNATIANRVMFQNSVTNATTNIQALPNGTSVVSGLVAFANSDPTNTSFAGFQSVGTEVRASGGITGTGSYPYMTFYTGGSERVRIDTSGNVGIGTSSPSQKLDVNGTLNVGQTIYTGTGVSTGDVSIELGGNRTGSGNAYIDFHATASTDYEFRLLRNSGANGTAQIINTGSGDIQIQTGGGNFVVNTVSGLGYGTGSGGTVTQATSRTTAVTINKPTGSITLVSAAGSSTYTGFSINNSIVGANDMVVLSIRSGMSNVYNLIVTNIGAGSFSIFVSAVVGTTTEAPVINFAVIKGATS